MARQHKPNVTEYPFKNANPELSDHIKKLLTENGKTYDDIAKIWGISTSTVSRRINDPSTISGWEASMLCDYVLGVDLESLMDGKDSTIGLPVNIIGYLYRSLSDEDKRAVSHIIARLAGPQAMHDAYQHEKSSEVSMWANEKFRS